MELKKNLIGIQIQRHGYEDTGLIQKNLSSCESRLLAADFEIIENKVMGWGKYRYVVKAKFGRDYYLARESRPVLSAVDLTKLNSPVDFEKIQNKKLIEKIENGGQENSPDTITAYKCGRGYLIVAAVAENTEVFFSTDEDKTKPESLIDWAIYDSAEAIQQQVTRCCYGVDTVADYSVAENFDGEVIICQEESLPGYSPITILTKNDVNYNYFKNDSYYRSDDYMVFKSVPEAQDWIQDSRGYTIWAAV